MNIIKRSVGYSLKLDVVRIFVMLNVAEIYRNHSQITNGVLFAYLDLLSYETVQKRIFRKLESNKRVVLDFHLSKEGKICKLHYDLYGVGNWDELEIEGIRGNNNGLCILHRYEGKIFCNWYNESELKSTFAKAIKCKTGEIANE